MSAIILGKYSSWFTHFSEKLSLCSWKWFKETIKYTTYLGELMAIKTDTMTYINL